ncbi:hypothetical protein Tco_1415935, partial [Tanacetum coccineum]
ALKPNQPEEPPFTTDMLAICSIDKPAMFKAPKPSSNIKRVPQGIKPGAKPRHKKHSTSLKQPYVSSKEATQAIYLDTGMHKEDQQVTGGPTSLGVTSKVRVNPQLSSGTDPHVLAYQTKSVSEGLETLEDLAKLVSHVQPSLKDLDSPKDDPVIVVDDSNEDEDDEVHATENVETEDTLVPKSSSPNSLPTKLKDLPSKFNYLTEEVKGLKNQVHNLEIKLLGELKEIPPRWKAKLKTLDVLLSLLNKVTNYLNQFAQAITSNKTEGNSVPSVGQAGTQPAEGEKNTNQATIS